MLTEFTASLIPYLRSRERDNPRIKELSEFGLEALLYLEGQQEDAHNRFLDQQWSYLREKQRAST